MDAKDLTGIAWDHRRAIDPLTATTALFAHYRPDVRIAWEKRPLSGFEFTSVDELAARYDLIILDHPFMGSVAESGSLLPVDDIVAGMEARFVGPSLTSYRMRASTWAVPVDAATQVQVVRPDLLDRLGAAPPSDWAGLIALGRAAKPKGLKLAIGLAGVHSLMSFFTLCANLGTPCADGPDQEFCDLPAARHALSLMAQLLEFCPPDVLDWNSIDLHDQMVARDDLVACPAVYCYATYAEADIRRPLRFHDFPGPNGPAGTTLGGTGLAISARCSQPEAARAYARFVADAQTQVRFGHHHGQPARIEAWDDPDLDAIFGGCFRSTRQTLEGAWIRPRYNGYLSFQETAGPLIEHFLREGAREPDALLDRLSALHRKCAKARGG
jgi:multiple sugar transport system substrate-binding protein